MSSEFARDIDNIEIKLLKQETKEDTCLKRKHIIEKIISIPNNVENTYYELKQEESEFFSLARKLGMNYKIIRTDDTNVYSEIEQIKNNMQRMDEQIKIKNDLSELEKPYPLLQELESLTQDGTIKTEHSANLKAIFEKNFDTKVQELIKGCKISKLEQEKEENENEKLSLIAKLLGKGNLKQAKLDNIELKMQLLMSEIRK